MSEFDEEGRDTEKGEGQDRTQGDDQLDGEGQDLEQNAGGEDDLGDQGQILGEEPSSWRRRIPPIWILGVMGALIGITSLGYLGVKRGPEVIEVIQSRECLTCHQELADELAKPAAHGPFRSRRCTACHASHGLELLESVTLIRRLFGYQASEESEKKGLLHSGEVRDRDSAPQPKRRSGLKMPAAELCADTCHENMFAVNMAKKDKMAPFKKKQCTSCHQAHASDQEYLLNAAIKPLCLSCHPKIAKYYSSSNLHPPFKVGSCTSCHRPHASNQEPLLRRRPKTLCLSCHQPIAKLMKLPTKMEPFELGNCPKCHNPHGTDTEKLLHKPVPDLCFGCHAGIAKLREKPVQMPPFRAGLCLGCHRPHASENPKLLQAPLAGNEICFVCHGGLKENYQPIGHNRVINNASKYQPEGGIGSCLNCHEPHGSDYERLVQKEVISLCLTCHGPRRYFAHPVGMNYEDPWRGGYLRCPSCHNPMGSGVVRLKRKDRDDLCLSCHEASDPSYIHFDQKPWHNYRIPDSFP